MSEKIIFKNKDVKVTYNDELNIYVVYVPTHLPAGWIAQGEWHSEKEAMDDAKNWIDDDTNKVCESTKQPPSFTTYLLLEGVISDEEYKSLTKHDDNNIINESKHNNHNEEISLLSKKLLNRK